MNRKMYIGLVLLFFINTIHIIAQTGETQKPVSKLEEKDLIGTCEELLMKAEDTDEPADYLVIVKKAIGLAGNDIALKVATKAALVEYHLSQKETKEAETLMAEIAGMVKGTTNLYANYKYQYAVADLLFAKEDYRKATLEFQKAMEIALKMGKPFYSKEAGYAVANAQYQSDEPVKALETVNRAIAIPVDERSKISNAKLYRYQSQIYTLYGDYEKALEADLEALKILQTLDKVKETAFTLKAIGEHYNRLKEYKKSVDYYKQAIKVFETLDQKEVLAECYGSLSFAVSYSSNTKNEAVGYAEKSYNMAKSTGNKKLIAEALLNLAIADIDINATGKMLPRLNEGLSIAREINDEGLIGTIQLWIGMYHDIRGEFALAIPFYKLLVENAEKSRASVPDELKLNYWKTEYGNYENIIGCYLHLKDFPNTVNAIEQSSARLLFERIARQVGKTDATPVEISKTNSSIPAHQALLFYGNSGGQDMAVLTANSQSIEGRIVNSLMWVKSIENKYKFASNENFEKMRAFKRISTENNDDNRPSKPNEEQNAASKKSFEDIVNNYRALLSKPNKDQTDLETLDFLGRRFYLLLIKPVEDKLADKTELVIIPNDVLAFLPFEALIAPDGKYLVEKFDIRYLPSYSVGEMLRQRTFPDNRKPILAFGNAVYTVQNAANNDRGFKSDGTQALAEQQNFNQLMKGIPESIKKGENMSKYYQALGYAWDNLPGTLAEVEALKALKPEAVIVKGKEVNKTYVKQLSKTGQLKNYKIVHFATHGVVIPEFQDLSALVLSQGQPGDDGYLRASEIAEMGLNADFVNLSACETGLGKIYGGEGVVGLSQSFLLAGANSVAVSLWQVSDASTMEFQKELYRLIFSENMSPSKAISAVKRSFVQRNDYKQPFYWAPFVYYGM